MNSLGVLLLHPHLTRQMITEKISELAVQVLDRTGYSGAAALMALESMIFPLPSEAVMPFVGFKVADGKWNLWFAIFATSLGSMIGSWLSYAIGYFGGKPLVLKVGKYLLLKQRDLDWTERFFHRRAGATTVFIGRFVPVVRHFISIPAGIGKMPWLPFSIATLIGATIWNTFLLLVGKQLRDNWHIVQKYSHQADIVIIGLIVVAVTWWFWSRRKSASAGQ
jgi:membrane protein DedA with SNARE-associated domain